MVLEEERIDALEVVRAIKAVDNASEVVAVAFSKLVCSGKLRDDDAN